MEPEMNATLKGTSWPLGWLLALACSSGPPALPTTWSSTGEEEGPNACMTLQGELVRGHSMVPLCPGEI